MPMDFIVLEMKEAPMRYKEHTVLLGRPFMATTKTVIDLYSGKLIMIVSGETIQFKVVIHCHILLLLLIINALMWII